MADITSDEEARAVARLISEGKITGAGRDSAMDALRRYDAGTQSVSNTGDSETEQTPEARKPFTADKPPNPIESLAGVGELALMAGTGALATAGSGIAGGLAALGGASPDKAANIVRSGIDKFTYSPRGRLPNQLFEELGGLAEKAGLEDKADKARNLALKISGGNPKIATALETTILGAPELLGLGRVTKSIAREMAVKSFTQQSEKELRKQIADKGIEVTNDKLKESLIKSAEAQAPTGHADNFSEIQKALKSAESNQRKARDFAYTAARRSESNVASDEFMHMGEVAKADLLERGFDIQKMPRVRGVLNDIAKIQERVIGGGERAGYSNLKTMQYSHPEEIVSLKEIDTLRQRTTMRSKNPREREALRAVRKHLDDYLDDAFDRAAILGDDSAIEQWQKARSLNETYKKNFSTDKFISKVIKQETTPEEMSRWLMGASAMGAKKEAATTIRRMKDILGEDHPSFQYMRASVMHDIIEPLMEDKPNFTKFARNIERTMDKNYSMVRELGLSEDDLELFRKAAHATRYVTEPPAWWDRNYVSKLATRLMFGHGISKAGARVNFIQNLMNQAIGASKQTQKELLRRMMEVDQSAPMIPIEHPKAAPLLVYGYLAGQAGAEGPEDEAD